MKVVIQLNLGEDFIDPAYIPQLSDEEIIDIIHDDIQWALEGATYEIIRGDA